MKAAIPEHRDETDPFLAHLTPREAVVHAPAAPGHRHWRHTLTKPRSYMLVLVLTAGVFTSPGIGAAGARALPVDVISDLDREVAPNSAATCPDVGAYSPSRPDPAREPTVVGLGIFFQDITALSDVEQTLDMDVYITMRWRDPRLAGPARGEGSAECPVPPDGRLWLPTIEPENLRNRQVFYPARFLVDGRGVVTYGRRLWLKTANPLDFRNFPFDRHRWTMIVWPIGSRSNEIVFHPLRHMTGINDRLSIQGWRVGTPRTQVGTAPRIARTGTFARFAVELELDRDWSYYVWKLGLPLTLIVLMAYGVYFIPASAVAQQIGLGMTSMLTLIAYMLTIGSTLPRISYLTRADRFFIGSALLVFLGLVKAVLTTVLGQGSHEHFLNRANHWGRWIYPLAILANATLAFLF
jgi:Neurotransmitter-gated ion-channel ligand binding domain